MDQNQALKRKIISLTLVFVVSLLAAVAIHFFNEKKSDVNIIHKKRIEEVLREKENRTTTILQRILKEKESSLPFIKLHTFLEPEMFQKEGLTVFLYKKDTLVFWSNNNLPAENIYRQQIFDKPVIFYGNGWFRVKVLQDGDFKALGLILLKNEYPYQNQYLTNDFQKDFQLEQAQIDTVPGETDISTINGEYLFSIKHDEDRTHTDRFEFLLFALMLICFISLVLLVYYLYHLFDFFIRNPLLLFLAFIFDAILIRALMLYFEIPAFLYDLKLFSPYFYATSFISPSLGDLTINSFLWLTLAWLFYEKLDFTWGNAGKTAKVFLIAALSLFSSLLFFLLMCAMRRLVMDSNIELNLNNIFNIDEYSIIAFFSLSCLILAYFLVTARFCLMACSLKKAPWIYILIAIGSTLLTWSIFYQELLNETAWIYPLFLIIYYLSLLVFFRKTKGYQSITGVLFYVVYFSLVSTFVLDYYHGVKEKENRAVMAEELASRRDPLMEYEFEQLMAAMESDSVLVSMLNERISDGQVEKEILSYINENYLNVILPDYNTFSTICEPDEMLNIQPGGYIENCHEYFERIMSMPSVVEVSPGFVFIDDKLGNSNYIACLNLNSGKEIEGKSIKIFIELYYKYVSETGLGYPDLLIDQKIRTVSSGLGAYSYAKYYHDRLIYKNGDFLYHLSFEPYQEGNQSRYFKDLNGFSHYVVVLDDLNKIILSQKKLSIFDLAAPFSYLFIFFSLLLLVFLLGFMFLGGYRNIEFNFSNQLQIAIILIIIVSFLVLGMITRSNIIHLYNDKNRENLSEKTFSVLTELEHKLGDEPVLAEGMQSEIAEYLDKFSRVFFSDINLYDTRGQLIASSRPQIFEKGLLSARMNTQAFYKLEIEKSLLYIQNEGIGKQEYLSAYIPFRNNEDKIIAYLNLPYFAKQAELRKEIADFLAAYINVYVLLIVLAIMVTVLVSRFITRPLQLIKEKMRNIGLGKSNEKIVWKKRDEIGNLVEEYNRMIDELAKSAELLARSERESAWREMARQVAHEIKNPLTPMKLSVQYLQKTWDDKSPDWEKHLNRFAQTIIEQIDNLSEIASEFSDFAKMPATSIEKIELTRIIKSAANLYHHYANIQVAIHNPEQESYVAADKRQLLRVFNNVIQNAVQAVGNKSEGRINISVFREERFYRVEIEDNGSGITDEQAGKIFSPSFTTKSSGTGLGLAMVKSIMNNLAGTVSFQSKPGHGTTFIVRIPLFIDNE